MPAEEIITLPTEWVGVLSWSKIGAFSTHHENFAPHDDAVISEWNTVEEPFTLRILRQSGRHLQIALISPQAESAVVGMLSRDGSVLAITSPHGSYLLNISQDSMTGTGHARSHESNLEHEHFGAAAIELNSVR